jgi:hypothetical protein
VAGYFKKVKTPWTSQPQIPAGIDKNNPDTRGLILATLSGSKIYDATRKEPLSSGSVIDRTASNFNLNDDSKNWLTTYGGAYSIVAKNRVFSAAWGDRSWFATRVAYPTSGIYHYINSSGYYVFSHWNGVDYYANSFLGRSDKDEVLVTYDGTNIGFTLWSAGTTKYTYSAALAQYAASSSGSGFMGTDNGQSIGAEWLFVFNRVLSEAEALRIRAAPWKLFTPQERRVFVSVASSDLNITTILATANASGFTANIDRQLVIATSLGTATASGFTANVDRQLSITTTLATATASGFTANISSDLNVTATLATATASAFSANVDRQLSITTTLATANASGFTANVDRQLFITTTLATATASGFDASIALGGGLNITATRAVATASGFDASITISTPQGSGWETYVAPIRKKTVKQFKEEFNNLTYFELEEKEDEVKSEIRLVEQDIRLNEDLGLDNLILKLKLALKIQKAKLQAIKSVKQEKIQEAQVQQIQHEAIPIEYTQDIDIIHEDENIDADLSYIAAILRMKYFN